MIIDKVYRRKIQSYANKASLVVSIPKEIREVMNLTSDYIASMQFIDAKKEIHITFNEKVATQLNAEDEDMEQLTTTDIIERKIMSLNEQLIFTIPAKKAKAYGIDEDTIVEMDGNVYKKILIIRVNGKDISLIDEVEEE